jgi:hypothetical protein
MVADGLKGIANFWSATAFIMVPAFLSLMYCIVMFQRLRAIPITVPPGTQKEEKALVRQVGLIYHDLCVKNV